MKMTGFTVEEERDIHCQYMLLKKYLLMGAINQSQREYNMQPYQREVLYNLMEAGMDFRDVIKLDKTLAKVRAKNKELKTENTKMKLRLNEIERTFTQITKESKRRG